MKIKHLKFLLILFSLVTTSCGKGNKHSDTVIERPDSETSVSSNSSKSEESFSEQNGSEQDSDYSSEDSEPTTSSYTDLPWI